MQLPGSFWALVEVMGHTRHWGMVETIEVAGCKMLQVTRPALAAGDVYGPRRVTRDLPKAMVVLGTAAVFRITPHESKDRLIDACLWMGGDVSWEYTGKHNRGLPGPIDEEFESAESGEGGGYMPDDDDDDDDDDEEYDGEEYEDDEDDDDDSQPAAPPPLSDPAAPSIDLSVQFEGGPPSPGSFAAASEARALDSIHDAF